jgi:energy-coupling factor transport system substrate-specific component
VRRIISGIIYVLSAAIGVLAFIYPFFADASRQHQASTHTQDAPLITAALVGLSVVALLVELQGRAVSAKTVALLGVLVALTSVLRFIETAVPMPGGFSPIFAPIILAGYVFGGRFGFLMGTFTLLASALITGGVGPWLPYQMFTAGWAGMTAGWLGRISKLSPIKDVKHPEVPPELVEGHVEGCGGTRKCALAKLASFDKLRMTIMASSPSSNNLRLEIALLCAFGFAWGLLYGVIINVYFWPFAAGPASQAWTPGLGLWETLGRYGTFYAVTSLGWDMARAVGNVALILLLGPATVRALTRFRRRFHFEVQPDA